MSYALVSEEKLIIKISKVQKIQIYAWIAKVKLNSIRALIMAPVKGRNVHNYTIFSTVLPVLFVFKIATEYFH